MLNIKQKPLQFAVVSAHNIRERERGYKIAIPDRDRHSSLWPKDITFERSATAPADDPRAPRAAASAGHSCPASPKPGHTCTLLSLLLAVHFLCGE